MLFSRRAKRLETVASGSQYWIARRLFEILARVTQKPRRARHHSDRSSRAVTAVFQARVKVVLSYFLFPVSLLHLSRRASNPQAD